MCSIITFRLKYRLNTNIQFLLRYRFHCQTTFKTVALFFSRPLLLSFDTVRLECVIVFTGFYRKILNCAAIIEMDALTLNGTNDLRQNPINLIKYSQISLPAISNCTSLRFHFAELDRPFNTNTMAYDSKRKLMNTNKCHFFFAD